VTKQPRIDAGIFERDDRPPSGRPLRGLCSLGAGRGRVDDYAERAEKRFRVRAVAAGTTDDCSARTPVGVGRALVLKRAVSKGAPARRDAALFNAKNWVFQH